MLEIRNLEKTYRSGVRGRGEVRALCGVNLTIATGMFGLLGPNGAGKSSLMRILAGLQLPDAGSVALNGLDVLRHPMELRKQLGYLPQSFGAYPYIACRSLLRHMAILKGLPDNAATRGQVDHLIAVTNLEPHAMRPVTSFSGGMRQRFGIAQALLGNPALLILDEPTAGLDPEERLRLYNLLSQLSADRIVLLSTHIVDDVEQLCPKVAIINGGQIVAQGATDQLVERFKGRVWQSQGAVDGTHGRVLLSTAYQRGAAHHRYYCDAAPGEGFEPVQASLQDCYFYELQQHGAAPCWS